MLYVVVLYVVVLYVVMLSVVMLSVIMRYVVMLSVVMLFVVMLSVIMLSVVMLSVVAPTNNCGQQVNDENKGAALINSCQHEIFRFTTDKTFFPARHNKLGRFRLTNFSFLVYY
jgi:hypothetical protein